MATESMLIQDQQCFEFLLQEPSIVNIKMDNIMIANDFRALLCDVFI